MDLKFPPLWATPRVLDPTGLSHLLYLPTQISRCPKEGLQRLKRNKINC